MIKFKKAIELNRSFLFEEAENIEVNEEEMEQFKKNAMSNAGCYLELDTESKLIVNGKKIMIDSGYMLYAKNEAINENYYINTIDELIKPHAPFKMKLYKFNKIVCKHIPDETIKNYNGYDLIVSLLNAPECYSILISYALSDDRIPMVNFHIADNMDCYHSFVNSCRNFKIFCEESKKQVLNLEDSTAEGETKTDNDDTNTQSIPL